MCITKIIREFWVLFLVLAASAAVGQVVSNPPGLTSATGMLTSGSNATSAALDAIASAAGTYPVLGVFYGSTAVGGIGGSGSTIYLGMFASSTDVSPFPVTLPGTVQCFTIFTGSTPAGGETWTFTVRKNSSNTSLSGTMVNGAFAVNVCPGTAFSVAAEDAISIGVTTGGATNLLGVTWRWSMTETH